MNTELLDAIRIIMQEELKPINRKIGTIERRLDSIENESIILRTDTNEGFSRMDIRLKKQDDKLDAMLEAWSTQKVHRRQLDDHEGRIQAVEHRISVTV